MSNKVNSAVIEFTDRARSADEEHITLIDGMIAGIEQIEYLLTLPQLNEVKPFIKELKAERKRLKALLTK